MDATIFICDKAGTVELCVQDRDPYTHGLTDERMVGFAILDELMDGVTAEIVTERGGAGDTCDIMDTEVVGWWEAPTDTRQELIYDTVGEWANKLGYEVTNIEHV